MAGIPHLRPTETSHQLIVKGRPFLVLGGELQNSSMTSSAYMSSKWQELVDMNVNTVLGCVTWEDIEPEEGRFDFTEFDRCVYDARRHGLHIVILWFGSFKNGVSSYVPRWVKTDPVRFPRAQLRSKNGHSSTVEVLSVFSDASVAADSKAFGVLMRHIKAMDEAHSTVIMAQVQNEVGILGDSRDRSQLAEERFGSPVPEDLINFLSLKWESLHPSLRESLQYFRSQGPEVRGGWAKVFGQSPRTDELFMAYHYARYLNRVATAGREAYPIPYYTNAWQDTSPEDLAALATTMSEEAKNMMAAAVAAAAAKAGANESDLASSGPAAGGQTPGSYPSGGPLVNVMDIWHRYAPALSFVSPDIYMNEFSTTCRKYRHSNQPLFIPEMRRDELGALRTWVAFGSYQALGVCPFGIDTLGPNSELGKHYALLSKVSAIILSAQARPSWKFTSQHLDESPADRPPRTPATSPSSSSFGFMFDPLPPSWKHSGLDYTKLFKVDPSHQVARFGDMELQICRAFVLGKPSSGAGMVIHVSEYKFLLIGWGFRVHFRSLKEDAVYTGILSFVEKEVVNAETGELRTRRKLNGDETGGGSFANMPSAEPDYGGFWVPISIPAETMIAEVEVYVV